MDSSNKKLLLVGLIILVVLVAAGITGAWIKYKGQKPQLGIDLSPEAVKAKCLEDVSKIDERQLIEKIKVLPFANNDDLKSLNTLIANHLICQTARNPTTEEQYREYKLLIERLKLSDTGKSEILAKLDLAYSNSLGKKMDQGISHPIYKLIVYDKSAICPNGSEDLGVVREMVELAQKRAASKERAESFVDSYCDQIDKYSKDEASLISEIYEFKDWFRNWPQDDLENLQERRSEYRWKVILAFRFGGEIKAKQVCSNLPKKDDKQDCEDWVGKIATWFTMGISADCTGAELKEAIDLICQLEADKYK